jgi:sulfate transport system permease protein
MATTTRERPQTSLARPRRSSQALGRWGLRGVALLYLGLAVVLPLSALVMKGFGDGFAALASGLATTGAVEAILLTLFLAAITAIVNGIFGTLIAYVLVRIPFRGRGVLATVVDVPFAIPTLVAGVMLVTLYGPNTPIGGWLADHGISVIFAQLGILLALLFVTLPLVVRTVQPVLLELDPAEEEAARVLGAGRWKTFSRVMLPALRPAMAAGALLAFARAIGEFGAIAIVSGNITGRTLTAPYYIFQLTQQFRYEEAAAVSTVLFAISFVLVLVTERLTAHRKELA